MEKMSQNSYVVYELFFKNQIEIDDISLASVLAYFN